MILMRLLGAILARSAPRGPGAPRGLSDRDLADIGLTRPADGLRGLRDRWPV